MVRALASPSESGNSESAVPWISSVGAFTRSATDTGEDRRSRSITCWVGRPEEATERYAAHTSAANRPHWGFVQAGDGGPSSPPPSSALRSLPEPEPKNSPAHCFLKTPANGSLP